MKKYTWSGQKITRRELQAHVAQMEADIDRDIAAGVKYRIMPWGARVLVDGDGHMIGPRRDSTLAALASVQRIMAERAR